MTIAAYTKGKRGGPKIAVPCGIDGCLNKIRANGLCSTHYFRARANGLNGEQMRALSGIIYPKKKEERTLVQSSDIIDEHGEYTPYIRVAAKIILQAVEDWARYKDTPDIAALTNHKSDRVMLHTCRLFGFKSPREELIEFFHSDWARGIFDELDMPYREFLAKIGVPQPRDH